MVAMSPDAPWYAMADLPPGRCRVRVVAQGRVFEAVRAMPPGSKALSWGLPPPARASAIEWRHDLEPEAWQPSVPGWTWPNGRAPAPLDTKSDRMWSSTMTFGAVDDAEAADLAREMERDRAGGGPGADGAEVEPAQRWRDVHEVAYREPGHITVADVEARVCRALCYERIIPPDIKRQRTNAAVLADLKRWLETLDADPTADYRPPFKPAYEDIRDYPVVMRWIAEAFAGAAVPWGRSPERVIMAGRIQDPPAAWGEIADEVGMSRQAVKKRYDRLLARLTRIANGVGVGKLAAIADQVQDRNRAFKRLAGGGG